MDNKRVIEVLTEILHGPELKYGVQLIADNMSSKYNDNWLYAYVGDMAKDKHLIVLCKEEAKALSDYVVPLVNLYDNGISDVYFEDWDEVAREDWAKEELVTAITEYLEKLYD